jgi:fermentation-respiration switch protein FrsA (DUF1100 family)
MTILIQTLKVIVLISALLLFFTYVVQRNLIYFPQKTRPSPQDFKAEDMRVISLNTKDGLALNAWYKPAQAPHPTILFLHGNAGDIGNRMYLARQFINEGFGILLFDYRGYGGNKGNPTEQGLYEDGATALSFLTQQGVASSQLVLYGESLGTGVATQLATQHPTCALILQSPFTSLTKLARFHYPWLPLAPWDKYDSLSRIKQINTPLFILHGTVDHIVPYDEGVTLFNAALEPKKMQSFSGYDHNNLWSAPDFYPLVSQFIAQHCVAQQPKPLIKHDK